MVAAMPQHPAWVTMSRVQVVSAPAMMSTIWNCCLQEMKRKLAMKQEQAMWTLRKKEKNLNQKTRKSKLPVALAWTSMSGEGCLIRRRVPILLGPRC